MKPTVFRFRLHAALSVLCALALLKSTGVAQSELENALVQYNAETVQGYVQPIADLYSANINAGFYHTAAIPTAGLHIEFSFVGMGSIVGNDQETYMANAPQGFDPSTFETATIFGDQGMLITDESTGLQYRGSDGILNTSIFAQGVLQLGVGYVFGTEAILRYLPSPSLANDKFPETTLFGVGVRHSVTQYIPNSPVDVAAGVFYNRLKVGEIIDFNSVAVGAQASKSFSALTLYGGLQWENSTMNLSFMSSDVTATSPLVDLDLDGDNAVRLTLGTHLTLAIVHLFVDANFGSITNFSGGIGIGI